MQTYSFLNNDRHQLIKEAVVYPRVYCTIDLISQAIDTPKQSACKVHLSSLPKRRHRIFYSNNHAHIIYSVRFFLFILLFYSTSFASESSTSLANPLNQTTFFPLGVWLQDPDNSSSFKKLGINLYVGLWLGPTSSQLRKLEAAGMAVICQQNEMAINYFPRDIILGWLQYDEPDNAQNRIFGLIYHPPISPQAIQTNYSTIKKRDSERPVLLNLGQGVAWNNWKGRGTRTNHPEDYKEYVKGGDILSFDIYPVTHIHPDVRGKLEYVAQGVKRLNSLVYQKKKVWNIVAVTRVNNPDIKPTPLQVRSQVWMSIIHGSRGIIYFVHQFKPRFIEAAIFEDPEMMRELTQLNGLIKSLAMVLNSPDTDDIKKLTTTSPEEPVAAVTKRHGTNLYLLSVAMRNKDTTGSFEFDRNIPDQAAEVLGENRKVFIRDGILEDHYDPYEPHIYKIKCHD